MSAPTCKSGRHLLRGPPVSPMASPQLSSDAWVALVAAGDAWTAFRQARGQLFREIKLRDLPVPTDPRRLGCSQPRSDGSPAPSVRALTVSGS